MVNKINTECRVSIYIYSTKIATTRLVWGSLRLAPIKVLIINYIHVVWLLSYVSLGLGPRHYTVHLRAVLLLQFMEHLDKLMYNAYEGSCVTLPLVPKVNNCMYCTYTCITITCTCNTCTCMLYKLALIKCTIHCTKLYNNRFANNNNIKIK